MDANDIPQDIVLNALEELRINQPNDQTETAIIPSIPIKRPYTIDALDP